MKTKQRPESLMMSYGYDPKLSENAVKCPIFQTSTFVFEKAEDGKAFFEIAYGLREKGADEEMGLIYSRLNNPDLEILENRLCLWDEAEDAASFVSGMAAISTTFMEFLKPGDSLIYSKPVYGGTDYFLNNILPKFGIKTIGFNTGVSNEEIIQTIKDENCQDSLAMVYLETPANPTNSLIDIRAAKQIADSFSTDEKQVLLAVDNTYMGPLWQHPLKHGTDLVIYSATKYIGGHSDVVAGAVLGSNQLIARVKAMRTFYGSMASPHDAWLLMRSLETLQIRMEKQASNAEKVADYLNNHKMVDKVYYLGILKEQDAEYKRIYDQQCESPGAMISFDIKGGEKAAFKFLNELKLIKLAVSLGSTESLAEHPATMTHSDITPAEQLIMGISENLVRISIGVEHYLDLIDDISNAFDIAEKD